MIRVVAVSDAFNVAEREKVTSYVQTFQTSLPCAVSYIYCPLMTSLLTIIGLHGRTRGKIF